MNIIRDPLFVTEDYRVNDGLIEFESNTLKNDLERVRQSAVIALVGDYGVGKSTALYNVRTQDKNTSHRWLQFDAWRYPERKGLWDGLIIEIAKQLGEQKRVAKKIDGNKSLLGKWGGILGEAFSQFGELLPKTELDKIEVDPVIAEKAARITQKAQDIFGRSPAKRVYELERILADILASIKEDIVYLVVEDIDRSGADGLNFLETLNFFIKNNEQVKISDKKIIVIAPVAKKNYVSEKDSYYKCVDIALNFSPTVKSAQSFIRQVFTDKALGETNGLIIENLEAFITGLFEQSAYEMNIRKLKAIIRQTALKYEALCDAYENVDWRAVLVFETMKNLRADGSTEQTMFERRAVGHSELSDRNIFSGLLMTIHLPNQLIYTYRYANSRAIEDREFNANIQNYKFLGYNPADHGTTSVWIGQDTNYNRRGYIAEYYRS